MPMVLTEGGTDSFERIAIDIYGPIVRPGQNPTHPKFVMTAICLLTKYSFAIPLTRIDAKTIASTLVEKIFCLVGTPKYLISDNAQYFSSKINAEFAKIFEIKHIFCSIYFPSANGTVERGNHTLTEYLKFFISVEKNWAKYLAHAMWAYNTSKNESTKYTPFELVFGKKCRLVTSHSTNEEPMTYDSYVRELQTRLEDLRNDAATNLKNFKLRTKRYFDRKLKVQTFSVGDSVFELNPIRSSKFDDEYRGPYEVIGINKEMNCVRIIDDTGKERSIPMARVKRAHLPTPELEPIKLS